MSSDAFLTLTILVGMFAVLAKTKLPPAGVFMGALTLIITFDLAPLEACLRGFSNSGMLTVGVLFMVAAGMYSTGAISLLSDKLIGSPQSTFGAKIKILPLVAVGSAFLNNTPIVAMLIPVIRDLASKFGLSAKQLYIPVSFASILGGACTVIGTATNLMLAGMISDQLLTDTPEIPPMRELHMFDPAWVAVPAMFLGLAFLLFFGKWLLPSTKIRERLHLATQRCYETEFVVEENGHLVGKSLIETGFLSAGGFELVSVKRRGQDCRLSAELKLAAGDVLTFLSNIEILPKLWATNGLIPYNTLRKLESERYTHKLVEAVISPQCSIIGRKMSELPLPQNPYRMWIVALSHCGRLIDGPIREERLEAGDNVVMEVEDGFSHAHRHEVEFSLIRRLHGARIQRTNRAMAASLITAAMVAIVTIGSMSMLNAALLATGLMLLSGCLSLQEAGRSIQFSTLIVMAAAIGLEGAVTHTGLAEAIADVLWTMGGDHPHIALAAVFVSAVCLSNFVAHAAAVALMFPIALSMATELGISFMPFAITIMMGASFSFMSPTGYQTNLMVYGPGGYRFKDYIKIGTPLTILVGLVTVFLTPMVFGF